MDEDQLEELSCQVLWSAGLHEQGAAGQPGAVMAWWPCAASPQHGTMAGYALSFPQEGGRENSVLYP